jgi:hypothetical protein
MNMRSALHHNRHLALSLAATSLAFALSTAAWAVPLETQPNHPFDKLTLAQPNPNSILNAYNNRNKKPMFIHGPTNVTMGFITAQAGDGCSGFARNQSSTHGPTNVSMGYITVQSASDCIISGSTDVNDVKLLAYNAEKARKSITKAFGGVKPVNGGGGAGANDNANGDNTGGGTSSTGGGPGGGGGGTGGGGGGPSGGPRIGGDIGEAIKVSPIPLPASLPLLAAAIAGLAATRRKKPKTRS